MNERDAAVALEGAELLPLLHGPIADIKRVIENCLEADIPVAGGMPPEAGKGWGTKIYLLVREDDAPTVMQLINREWLDMLQREGTVNSLGALTPNEEGELPCPACGTAAPLVEGACTDCGLVLE